MFTPFNIIVVMAMVSVTNTAISHYKALKSEKVTDYYKAMLNYLGSIMSIIVLLGVK